MAKKIADALEELKQRCTLTLAIDVTWGDDVLQKIVTRVVEAHGTIDILVSNAGYFHEGTVAFENTVLALRHQELDDWAELVPTTDFDDDA
uniref:Ketoreductase (KR) domain-containing protein n=1 Tax=Globisporangium ultimum (strain ATCC 200006 / CBS 805.95 / DAOM BR144) TaxID=431595 RepID=K3WB08_GLOUD